MLVRLHVAKRLDDMDDQQHTQEHADSSVESDPAVQPCVSDTLGIELEPLLDGVLQPLQDGSCGRRTGFPKVAEPILCLLEGSDG